MGNQVFSRKIALWAAAAILVVSCAPARASAQDGGGQDPWPEVRKLKDGTHVTVTLTTGATQHGKIVSSSSTAFSIALLDGRTTVPTDISIGQVERVRTTGSYKPMIWGALTGMGAAIPMMWWETYSYNEGGGTDHSGAYRALGIGAGLGIGYAAGRPRTLYTRPSGVPSPQVLVSPVILRKGGGLAMAIRF